MNHEVSRYIAQFDPEIGARLMEIRNLFFEACPELEEEFSYKMPAYKKGKNRLYFSAFKKHIGSYPVSGLEELKDS